MNDRDFTNRLDASLRRGMASVPLPALEPAKARYRIAAGMVGRRPVPRLTVAMAAIGLALLTGVVGVAASGTSPTALVSAGVHRVVVLLEEINTPGELVLGTSSREPESVPAGGPGPSATTREPVAAPGDPDRASERPATAEPAPIEEPRTPPKEEPAPEPAD